MWGSEALGLPIHDNWWQTETGGIMIANYAPMDIRPGSMGRPLPGIEAAVARRDEDGDGRRRGRRPRARRRRGGRAGAAAGLAVDVPRLPRRATERYRALLRRRLVSDAATSCGATPTATSGSSAAATT